MLVQSTVAAGVGSASQAPVPNPVSRGGALGDLIVSELGGRFYEHNYRSGQFSGGMTATAINNATFTSATLGATCTPILGVWNPSASNVNLEILQATLQIALTAATVTGGGPFVWAASTGNAALTLGGSPWNRKTLAQAGSQAKNMAGVALTGLTNNLVVIGGSALGAGASGSFSFVGTAAGESTLLGAGGVENIDGSFIVPPGGVLALLATTTPVGHSAASSLLWNEKPV